MAKHLACGKDAEKSNKEWKLGKVHVKQYECCGKKGFPGIRKDGLAA
jgi:hypothetical protein